MHLPPVLLAAADQVAIPVVVVLCGDSTMAHHPPNQPVVGWGDHFGAFTAAGVQVVNAARSGASTRTYRAIGLWTRALASKPTWVLIQFGHNDSHGLDKPESTAADGDFSDNLHLMVDEARAAGARPVLITPVQRRQWLGNGTLNDGLAAYAAATIAVAAERQILLIDLHRRSGEEYRRMGRAGTEALSPAPGDFSHFTQAGAQLVAGWVGAALPDGFPRAAGTAPVVQPVAPLAGGSPVPYRPEGH